MFFETLVVGPLGVNCFLLADEQSREAVVIDPGADGDRILSLIAQAGLKVGCVINTHGHFDHIGGNKAVVEKTGAKLLIHQSDLQLAASGARTAASYGISFEASPEPTGYLTDGQQISFGRHTIEVLHTPGHTPGGCSLYLADEKMAITGDTLFAESIGRTDFPGGSHEQLIASIRTKLLTLPDETVVWPGHGPSTSIGAERAMNPYLG